MYTESIRHFLYFIFNFSNGFVEKCWADEPQHIQDHIKQKWEDAYDREGAVGAVPRFFMELDAEQQDKFASWVEKNYTGYKMKKQSKHHYLLVGENLSEAYYDNDTDLVKQYLEEENGFVTVFIPDDHENPMEEFAQVIDGWGGFATITEEEYNEYSREE